MKKEDIIVGKQYFLVEEENIRRIKVTGKYTGKDKKGYINYSNANDFERFSGTTKEDNIVDNLTVEQKHKLLASENEAMEKRIRELHEESVIDTTYKELELHSDELDIQSEEKAKELLPYVKNHYIDMLASYCDGKTEIKEWERDGCPYDNSGEVYSTHEFLTMENTVEEVLGNYTGNRVATFESGHGWDFRTIQEDDFDDFCEDIADKVVVYVVKQYFENHSIPYYEDADIYEYVNWIDVIGIFDVEDMFDTDLKIKDLLSQKEDLPENELWNTITSKK